MFSHLVLNPPSTSELEAIYRDLGVDEDKIENNLKLLLQWLQCENYLPNDMDEFLLRNFLLGCKGNLEKTKQKIEKYLMVKTRLSYLFMEKCINDDDYVLYQIQRCVYVSTNYTEKGYRIIIYRVPTIDATYFDTIKILKYIFLVLDFLLHYDTTAGYEFIYDATNVNGQTISKLNLIACKHCFDLFYNILPIRTRSIFVLNTNKFFEVALGLARGIMPKKIRERVRNGKFEDLVKVFPKNCLPFEYGGTDKPVNELSDNYLKLFKHNQEWIEKVGKVKLAGALPAHKKDFYSFDEFNMGGSFRKLNID